MTSHPSHRPASALSSAVLDLNSSGGRFWVLPPIQVVIEIGRAIP
jgi:hypothetical protein